jgi:DNA polymerase III subunit epsilon
VVIEVGVVDLTGVTLYETLIKPPIPIPADAMAIHGITEAMVSNAPRWAEAWADLRPVLEGRYIGAYNKLILTCACSSRPMGATGSIGRWTDKNFFCVMKLYAAFYGQRSPRGDSFRFHKLEAAGAACRIPLPNAHRAVDDAKLTAALFNYIANYSA